MAHSELITDCVEISGSDLLATSSLDGFIRIWSLETYKLKTELEDVEAKKHPSKKVVSQTETVKSAAVINVSGVRCMSYTPEFGGNLVTCGYTNYVNVWSPESSLSKAYMGKLEGHNGIVISCKVFPKSPTAVSIDDKFCVRIWDIRNFTCSQTIRNDAYDPATVSCLAVLPGESRFLVGGKRLLLFTNEAMQKDQQTFNEELVPLSVSFNPYFNFFTVVTKQDLRIYDAFTGKLKKIITGLVDAKNHVDITGFQVGSRSRKFFISDNLGFCKLYNFKSGELLSKVIEPEDKQKKPLKAHQQATKGQSRKEKQIVELIFVEEQKLIITCLGDSSIKVYESKDNSEVELIKEIKGGHPKADITIAKYAKEVCTLYTGASDGSVACWSLESSRLTGYFQDDKTDITALTDLYPYPAILVGNSKGFVSCWKTIDVKKRYPLLFKINIFDSSSATPVRPISSTFKMSLKSPPNDLMISSYSRHSNASSYSENAARRPFDDSMAAANFDSSTSLLKRAEKVVSRGAALDLLLLGTGFGTMQVFSIDAIMELVGLEQISHQPITSKENDRTYRVALLRKESINGENCGKLLHDINKLKPPGKTSVFLDDQVNLRTWRAHKEALCSINTISTNTDAFLTCGEDRFIRIWTLGSKMLCQINIVNPSLTQWNFPYDWAKLILKELEETFMTVEQLDRIVIGNKQREALQVRYLYSNFVLPEIKKTFPHESDIRVIIPSPAIITQKTQFFSRIGE